MLYTEQKERKVSLTDSKLKCFSFRVWAWIKRKKSKFNRLKIEVFFLPSMSPASPPTPSIDMVRPEKYDTLHSLYYTFKIMQCDFPNGF